MANEHSQYCAFRTQLEDQPTNVTEATGEPTAVCTQQEDMCKEIDPNTGLPYGSKTSDFYKVEENLPQRFDNPDWFKGYGTKAPENPMYRTTASDIGKLAPNVHTMPTVFYSRSQMFTNHLGPCGMYRNHSLNTANDPSLI